MWLNVTAANKRKDGIVKNAESQNKSYNAQSLATAMRLDVVRARSVRDQQWPGRDLISGSRFKSGE